MLKLIGAGCVMAASIGYTGYLLENRKLHKNSLQSLISMAELLAGYIGYERLTMEEVFLRLSGGCRDAPGRAKNERNRNRENGVLNVVLAHVADRLAAGTDGSFESVWREVFCEEASNMFLSEEELSIVLEMGKSLGGADIETQIRCLQGSARRLEEKLAAAGQELAEKRKLYRYLGVAAGAMAVLVLI